MLSYLKKDLKEIENKEKSKILSKFFKTGKGEYGEGDVFFGITVPNVRGAAKKYSHLELSELQNLLSSKVHEYRLIALLILIDKYKKTNLSGKKEIFNFYLANTKNINNWDLVDLSASYIVGDYLYKEDKSVLYKLAKSDNLWEKRISIISTFNFIKNNNFEDTLKISKVLLNDEHDLIHKAVGWMLREVGKRNKQVEKDFLNKYYKKMPRTMLRYSIEKFNDSEKRFYLKK